MDERIAPIRSTLRRVVEVYCQQSFYPYASATASHVLLFDFDNIDPFTKFPDQSLLTNKTLKRTLKFVI